jgi:dolichol-phosphate mannosyltransferase
MTDETATVRRTSLPRRVRLGLRRTGNWLELVRFGAVGASGYVVNLAVFTVLVGPLELPHLLGAVGAWLVAVLNNFFWNRHWTFGAHDGHAGFQAARFFVVSLVALGVNLLALELLVSGGMAEVPAQALAIVLATPCNFLGNKLWAFDR